MIHTNIRRLTNRQLSLSYNVLCFCSSGIVSQCYEKRLGPERSFGNYLLLFLCFGFDHCYWYKYQAFLLYFCLTSKFFILWAYSYASYAFLRKLNPGLRVAQDKPSGIVFSTVLMCIWIYRLSSVPPHLLYYCYCVIIM